VEFKETLMERTLETKENQKKGEPAALGRVVARDCYKVAASAQVS